MNPIQLWKLLALCMRVRKEVNVEGKKVYQSKTFWINVLALIAMVAQTQLGFVIDAETQVAILAVINLILRIVTGAPIEWKSK